MFFNKFKKVDFKYSRALVNLQLSYHLYELLFLLEAFKNLPLVKRNRDDALLFRGKNFLIFLYGASSIFEFLYFVSSQCLSDLFRQRCLSLWTPTAVFLFHLCQDVSSSCCFQSFPTAKNRK